MKSAVAMVIAWCTLAKWSCTLLLCQH